jgi:membrane-associated phospholipid phosphatase
MSASHSEGGERLRLMTLGWGAVGLVYFGTGYLPREAQVLPLCALDHALSFEVRSVWLYLAFFVLVPWAYLGASLARVRWLARAMPACALVCALCFLAWPTTLAVGTQVPARAVMAQGGASAWAYRWLLAGDTPRNCLPSLHGALTLLCAWALLERGRPLRNVLVLALAAAIAWSVLALRRHVAVDLAAGLLLGWLAGHWAQRGATSGDHG